MMRADALSSQQVRESGGKLRRQKSENKEQDPPLLKNLGMRLHDHNGEPETAAIQEL